MKNNKTFLLSIVLFLSLTTIYLFKNYLYIIIVSMILALATNSIMSTLNQYFNRQNNNFLRKNKTLISSSVLSIGFLLFIFTPFIYFVAYSYTNFLPKLNITSIKEYAEVIIAELQNLPSWLSIFQDNVNLALTEFNLTNVDIGVVKNILAMVLNFVKNLNLMLYEILLIMLFYFMFNIYGIKIKSFIYSIMPLRRKTKQHLFNDFANTSAIVLYGTLFSMFAQGIAFAVLMAIMGYDYLYLGLMAGFLSVIPVIGAALVFVPITIIELIQGNVISASIIVVYSVIFMGFVIDNIFKVKFITYINKKLKFDYSISEIMVLISMVAAIGTVGFWGIIVGPAVVSLTIAALNIYKKDN